MLLPSPLLLHLTSSFVISTLRLTVEPENYEEFRWTDALVTPFILISPNRNISFSLRGASFLADELPLSTVPPDEPSPKRFIISARCEHGFALRVHVGEAEKTFPSPSFCANHGMNGGCTAYVVLSWPCKGFFFGHRLRKRSLMLR